MADSIALVNGNIVSLDDSGHRYAGLVIESGRITQLGSAEELRAYAQTRGLATVDLGGRTVVPGAIDTHFHMTITGMHLASVDFNACRSVDEVLQLLRAQVASAGERWIVGKGLDEFELKEKRPPTARELDRVSGKVPVFIEDRGYHFVLVNSEAFRRLGISPDAPGVRHEPDGGMSGQLMEEIMGEARRVLLSYMEDTQKREVYRQAARYAARCGVTTLHAIEGGPTGGDSEIPLLFELKDQLPVRVKVYWITQDVQAVLDRGQRAFGGDILLDGNLGASTAALLEPYADGAKGSGELYFSQAAVDEMVAAAARAELQIGFHVIGDRAIEQALLAFEKCAGVRPRDDMPFRLDHFGVPTRNQVHRAADLGVVIATQPPFPFRRSQPGGVYESRLGKERLARAYALRDFLDAGLLVAGGSDSSVMPADYMLGIHSAVNHPNPSQRLTREEAFRLYTRNAACLGFEAAEKGSLEIGKLGDVVVVGQDPFRVPDDALKDIPVHMTIKGGEIVFDGLHKH